MRFNRRAANPPPAVESPPSPPRFFVLFDDGRRAEVFREWDAQGGHWFRLRFEYSRHVIDRRLVDLPKVQDQSKSLESLPRQPVAGAR